MVNHLEIFEIMKSMNFVLFFSLGKLNVISVLILNQLTNLNVGPIELFHNIYNVSHLKLNSDFLKSVQVMIIFHNGVTNRM